MTRRSWIVSSLVIALLAVALPAYAVGATAVATATSDGSVPFPAAAVCVEAAEIFKDLTDSTRVIEGTADAPGATGTRVECVAYNLWGSRIGGCQGALPGPKAVCVGLVDAPLHTQIRLCAIVWAQYPDGSLARSRPCP